MGGVVRMEKDGHLGWVIFDHPERRNAISVEMWQQIPEIVEQLEGDEEVRVVVMRGAGEVAFVAGADISQFESSRTGANAGAYDVDSGRAIGALARMRKPLLAQIQGYCVGGGVGIALTADVRYASDDSVFAIPAARLGLGYAMPGLESLAHVVGLSNAKEIFFTARRFSAEEAEQKGLVNALVPRAELAGYVRERANEIAANAPLTVRSVKLIVGELAKPASARDVEAANASVRECFESDDYKEGVRAFLEKRPPEFKGH